MATIKIKGTYKGNEVEIYVSLYSYAQYVYKRVEYYLNGEQVTRRNKIIKELTEPARHTVLTKNTYFWKPFPGNKFEREALSEKLLKKVAEALPLENKEYEIRNVIFLRRVKEQYEEYKRKGKEFNF